MTTVIEMFKTAPWVFFLLAVVFMFFVHEMFKLVLMFFVELFWGPPYFKPVAKPKCEHEDNLTKICNGCGTKEHCRTAVEEHDY